MGLDWAAVEAAFDDLTSLPENQRATALADLPLPERERHELRALLAAHDEERRIPRAGPHELQPGEIVGRFRIVEPIGRGGMGTVHLAERVENFTQRVAVKTMTGAGPQAIRRFQTELRALAALSHPHIVSVFDAGTGPGGVPYLVMEHVEGVPVTDYCRAERLALPARLRLCARLAAAVHYAHSQGVIHRDLKPSNLFVTADGAPKILDFGIARLADADAAVGGRTASALLAPVTMNYASPEQLRGLPATERSDLFSLGVVAFEMLANARPRDLVGLPLDDVLRQVALPPEPPSRRARAAELPYAPAALAGGIDRVILRAIAVDPIDRYESALALGGEFDRLAAEAEIAAADARPGVPSRHRSFRRAAAVAAAASVTALVLFAAGSGRVSEAPPAEPSSGTPRPPAEPVTAADRVAATPEPAGGVSTPQAPPADRATAVPTAVPASAARAVELRVSAANAFSAGRPAEAEDLMQQSISIRRALLREQPGEGSESSRLAWSLSFLARIRLALERPTEALEAATEAVRLGEPLSGLGPLNAVDFAYNLETLARVQLALDRRSDACASFIQADVVFRRAQPLLSSPPERAVHLDTVLGAALAECARGEGQRAEGRGQRGG